MVRAARLNAVQEQVLRGNRTPTQRNKFDYRNCCRRRLAGLAGLLSGPKDAPRSRPEKTATSANRPKVFAPSADCTFAHFVWVCVCASPPPSFYLLRYPWTRPSAASF